MTSLSLIHHYSFLGLGSRLFLVDGRITEGALGENILPGNLVSMVSLLCLVGKRPWEWGNEVEPLIMSNSLRTVPTNSKVFLRGCMDMREKQGYLPFTRENRKFQLEDQMVRAIPFGKLLKIWALICGDAIFLLF